MREVCWVMPGEAVVVVAADGRDFPALVQRVDESLVVDLVVGVDDLQHRDDVGDLRVAVGPVVVLVGAGMVEAGDDRAVAVGLAPS